MSQHNGYDARGEDLALSRRIDQVDQQAQEAARQTRAYTANVEGEVISRGARTDQLLHKLQETLANLSHSVISRFEKLQSVVMDLRSEQADLLRAVANKDANADAARKDVKLGLERIQKQMAELLKRTK